MTRREFLINSARAAIALTASKGFCNTTRYSLQLVKRKIYMPNLPQSFNNFKIALLSDFHSSYIVTEGLIASAAQLTMKEKPDIII
ncbi:metallophosphoesterase, partial [Candidatus Omnitrophus magneticus]